MGAIFGGGPKIPAPPPPQPMPDLMDPAILAAKRRAVEASASSTGRGSTILSGGDEYSTDKLGVR